MFFGGQEATKVEVDKTANTIKAVTPAFKKASVVDVEVINADGKKGTLKEGYTYEGDTNGGDDAEAGADGKKRQDSLTPAPALEVKDVDPKEGPTAGEDDVTITGTGFLDKATVTFGGEDAKNVVVVDATTITAVTPPHEAGPVEVEVTNVGGLKDALKDGYTYGDTDDNGDTNVAAGDASTTVEVGDDEEENAAPIAFEEGLTDEGDGSDAANGAEPLAPTIDSIEPPSGSLEGMEKIEITETNFSDGATVKIGGKSATVDASTPTLITVLTPPGDKEGSVDVVITITDDLSVTETDGYTYTA